MVPERNRKQMFNTSYPDYNHLCRRGTDPLVHHGRHFGRTVHALCSVNSLLTNGILRMGELVDQPENVFTHEYVLVCKTWLIMTFAITCRERKEHRVFDQLLQMVPGLEDRLLNGSDEEVGRVAELVSAYNLLLICSGVLIDS